MKSALENTIIVAAPADEAAPTQYIAPTPFRDVDYFSHNAKPPLRPTTTSPNTLPLPRQMSLLLRSRRSEAYPATVLLPALVGLLERAVKLNDLPRCGSLTAHTSEKKEKKRKSRSSRPRLRRLRLHPDHVIS